MIDKSNKMHAQQYNPLQINSNKFTKKQYDSKIKVKNKKEY